jgi:hypothetical protein
MTIRIPLLNRTTADTGSREPLSSSPRGATGQMRLSSPPGFLPRAPRAQEPANPSEKRMTELHLNTISRHAVRAAMIAAGLYLVFAVGAPWMLHNAPPSPQDVVAAKVCCDKAASNTDAHPAK